MDRLPWYHDHYMHVMHDMNDVSLQLSCPDTINDPDLAMIPLDTPAAYDAMLPVLPASTQREDLLFIKTLQFRYNSPQKCFGPLLRPVLTRHHPLGLIPPSLVASYKNRHLSRHFGPKFAANSTLTNTPRKPAIILHLYARVFQSWFLPYTFLFHDCSVTLPISQRTTLSSSPLVTLTQLVVNRQGTVPCLITSRMTPLENHLCDSLPPLLTLRHPKIYLSPSLPIKQLTNQVSAAISPLFADYKTQMPSLCVFNMLLNPGGGGYFCPPLPNAADVRAKVTQVEINCLYEPFDLWLREMQPIWRAHKRDVQRRELMFRTKSRLELEKLNSQIHCVKPVQVGASFGSVAATLAERAT